MLVLDEVQCGVARTGTLYAYEQYGITPDIMASAKGIGGGFPLGACLATEKAAAGWSSAPTARPMAAIRWRWRRARRCSTSSPTRSSSPTSGQMGERLRSALEQMIPNHDHLFESVRGHGPDARRQDEDRQPRLRRLSAHQGLLTVAAGDNVVRVLPPLIIEERHIARVRRRPVGRGGRL